MLPRYNPTPVRSSDLPGYLRQELPSIARAIPRQHVVDATRYLGSGSDHTAGLQKALNAGTYVVIPDGDYAISDTLTLSDNHRVYLSPGVTIRQTVANKTIFTATQKDNVWLHCNGAVLYGEGSWSSGWTGMQGHNDRGIQFLGCTRSGVTFPTIKNMANAGIAIRGGSNIKVVCPTIEGTNSYSTPLSSGDNFQVGLYVVHDTVYGAYEAVQVVAPSITGTCHGVLTEPNVEAEGQLTITDATIFDIPGQHGCYFQSNNVRFTGSVDGCALDGIKYQTGALNQAIHGYAVHANVSNCPNGQAFHVAVAGTGSITGVSITGTAYNCSRALTIDGEVSALTARISADVVGQYGLYIFDTAGSDIDVEIIARNVQQHGVLVNASTLTRARIRPQIYRPSRDGSSKFGVYLAACGEVILDSPVVVDDDSKMSYGIYVDTNATAKITGTPIVRGYTTNGIRVAGTCEWHASGGDFTSLKTAHYNGANLMLPVTPLSVQTQTTSASNLTAWQLTLADESAYLVKAEVVGKLSGSAERGGVVTTVLAYRDAGGGATIEGSADTDVNITSAGFLGAVSWAVSGNILQLRVNSGAAATTVDWTARVTVTRMV